MVPRKLNDPIPTHHTLNDQQPPKLLIPSIQNQRASCKRVNESPQLSLAIRLVSELGVQLIKPRHSLLMPVNQTVILT